VVQSPSFRGLCADFFLRLIGHYNTCVVAVNCLDLSSIRVQRLSCRRRRRRRRLRRTVRVSSADDSNTLLFFPIKIFSSGTVGGHRRAPCFIPPSTARAVHTI